MSRYFIGPMENDYATQLDNPDLQSTAQREPYVTCNVTSLWMMLKYIFEDIYAQKFTYSVMDLFSMCNSDMAKAYAKKNMSWALDWSKDKRLNQVWGILEMVSDAIIKDHNLQCIDTVFIGTMNSQKIIDCISKGMPVMLSTTFTASGHIVVAYGFEANDSGDVTGLILHDPYGEPTNGYKRKGATHGRSITVPWSFVKPKLKTDRGLSFVVNK